MIVGLGVALMVASPALAQTVDLSPVQNVLQGIVDALVGPLGLVVGTLALMGVFLAWLFGYIDWSRAIMVLVAIVGVASAPVIAATIFA
ncbi:TrbC/VirB2 family protein [Rubellimicrobium rubrum]|uniref:TrbC/VirB2 family protein n=1 Tax=Rubellimicrobium rubrum TaxID=2585369 RepID=A0A5C4MU87_9RHOB|nr:TrbC/VirB2 family protein [Rubellimicrobium rubrum]